MAVNASACILQRLVTNSFDKDLCIICQKDNGKTTSTLSGCTRIRDAAAIRNDEVYQRVLQLAGDGIIFNCSY